MERVKDHGPIRQIGFIVRDIDAAMRSWVASGVGPFFVLRRIEQSADYRGTPCTVTLSVAFANSGDLQVELIQQHGDTPSIYREFLDAGHEGFNQIAYWTDDLAATMATVPWPVVWSGGGEGSTGYAYVVPGDGVAAPVPIIEFMQNTPATQGLAHLVRTAAAAWDGSDPIRELGRPT